MSRSSDTELPSPPPSVRLVVKQFERTSLNQEEISFMKAERNLSNPSLYSCTTVGDHDLMRTRTVESIVRTDSPKLPKKPLVTSLTPSYSKNALNSSFNTNTTPKSHFAHGDADRISRKSVYSEDAPLWHSSPCSTPRGTINKSQGRYTTSLASLPTPNCALRISSQRRVPFSFDSYRTLPSPRDSRIFSERHSRCMLEPIAASTPAGSISRGNFDLNDSILSYETTAEFVEDDEFIKCVTRLSYKEAAERERIRQAKRMILMEKRSNNPRNSMSELHANGLIVISQARMFMYKELISRIETFHRMRIGPPPISRFVRSRVTIKGLQLSLSRHYYVKENSYVFMIVGSTHEKVLATEVLHISDGGSLRAIRIRVDEEMTFLNLPLNFQIRIEVYAMKLVNRQTLTPKELAKKALSFIGHCASPITQEEIDKQECGFKPVGHVFITRDNTAVDGYTNYLISNNDWPLDGRMEMKCECTPLPPQLYQVRSGYWNLISGPGDVTKYVKSFNGIIRFYNSASDVENFNLDPSFIIDMSTVCNRTIEREPPKTSNDPEYAFHLDVLSFPRGCDLCEHKRFLVGFDSEEFLMSWIEYINACLDVILFLIPALDGQHLCVSQKHVAKKSDRFCTLLTANFSLYVNCFTRFDLFSLIFLFSSEKPGRDKLEKMEIPKLRSAEKEAELDRKIEEIRKKNQILEQRHQETKKDAEENGIPKLPTNHRPNKPGKTGSNKDSNVKTSEKIGEKKKSTMTESKGKNGSNREWDAGKTPADSWKVNVPDIGDHDNKYFKTEATRGKRRGAANAVPRPVPGTRNPGYFHDDRLDAPKRGGRQPRRGSDRNQNDSSKPNMNLGPESHPESKTSTGKPLRGNKKPSFDGSQSFGKKPAQKHNFVGKTPDLPNQNLQKPKPFSKYPSNRVKNPGQFGAKKPNKNYDSDERTVKRVLDNLIDKVVLFERKEKRATSNNVPDAAKDAENHAEENGKDLEQKTEDSAAKVDENENSKVENADFPAENPTEPGPTVQESSAATTLESSAPEPAVLPSETTQPVLAN
uniref:Anillin homology domain-containing protein n=1 Tax=Panagrolaimus sp. JU765 TaxID=591449 RepID=A0AC34QFT1_9BILA